MKVYGDLDSSGDNYVIDNNDSPMVALIRLVLKYNMLEVIAMIKINDQIVHLDLLKILTKATPLS